VDGFGCATPSSATSRDPNGLNVDTASGDDKGFLTRGRKDAPAGRLQSGWCCLRLADGVGP
jgi:hypothetical protein